MHAIRVNRSNYWPTLSTDRIEHNKKHNFQSRAPQSQTENEPHFAKDSYGQKLTRLSFDVLHPVPRRAGGTAHMPSRVLNGGTQKNRNRNRRRRPKREKCNIIRSLFVCAGLVFLSSAASLRLLLFARSSSKTGPQARLTVQQKPALRILRHNCKYICMAHSATAPFQFRLHLLL